MRLTFPILWLALGLEAVGQPFTWADPMVYGKPPFTPAKVSNLYVWLKADAGLTPGAHGAPIVDADAIWKWENQSPAATKAENFVYLSCNVPTSSGTYWYAAGPNGLPTVRCVDTAVPLQSGGCGSPVGMTNPVTVIALLQQYGTLAGQSYLFNLTATAVPEPSAMNLAFDYDNAYGCSAANLVAGYKTTPYCVGTIPSNLTNWTVLTCCFNGANSFVRTNGVLAYPVFTTSTTFPLGSTMYILNFSAGGANQFRGNVTEFIMYHNASLATNDLIAVECYLGQRGNVTQY